MATIHINRDRVDSVIKAVVQALGANPQLHPLEAVIGLSEAAARVIAVQEGTFILHKEMLRVAEDHMTRTVRAAYSARGQNPEALN